MENKIRGYRSNQGRNPKKSEDSAKIMIYGCVIAMAIFIVYGIVNTIHNVLV